MVEERDAAPVRWKWCRRGVDGVGVVRGLGRDARLEIRVGYEEPVDLL